MEVPSNLASRAAEAASDNIGFPWVTWVWVALLSAWGGVVGYIKKVHSGRTPRFSVMEFIGELVTSSFIGVLTFLLCSYYGMDELLTAALVGSSGFTGSRLVYLVEGFLQRKFGLKIDINLNENTRDSDKS